MNQFADSASTAVNTVGNVTVADMVKMPLNYVSDLISATLTGGVNVLNKARETDVSPLLAPSAALFGFYVAINGGKITKSMGCQVQNMLDNSMLASQVLAFLTIVFFSSLVTAAPNTMEEFITQIKQSIGLYIVYLLSTKLAKESFVLLVAILSIVFLLRKVSRVEEIVSDSDKSEMVKTTSNGLLLLGLFVLIFGVASYTGQKLIEYKDNKGTWSWTNYIFGKPSCANDGSNATYVDGLKRVLGITQRS